MATELGQAYVQIIPSAKGISGSIQKQLDPEATAAGTSAGAKIGSSLKIAAIAAVATAGVAIGKTVSSAISEGAQLEQSLGGIETLFKGSADKVKKYADEAYKTSGLSANDYMQNVTSFSASLLQSLGGDTEKAADTANMAMIDMSDNANKMGTNMTDIQNAYQGFAKQNYTMLDNLKLGYGGTKSEMERLLADAQKLTGVKYDINNLSDVYNAIHAVQEELDITGTTAKEASETLSGSLAAMKSAFSNVLGKMALGQSIQSELNALSETTSTFLFDNFLPMVGNVLKALPQAIGTFISASGPKFAESGMNLVSQLANGFITGMPNLVMQFQSILTSLTTWLTENLPNFLFKGLEMIGMITQGIVQAIPQLYASWGETLNGLFAFITENLPMFLQKGVEILSNIATGIFQAIPQLITTAGSVVTGFVGFLVENLPTILMAGVQLLSSLLEGLVSALPSIATAALNVITSLVTYLLDNLPQIVDSGIQILTELVSTLTANVPKLAASAMDIIVGLVQYLIQNFPKIVITGVEIVAKLASGIVKNIPDIIKACAEIVSTIIDKISSISLVDAGKAIIDGFVQGLQAAWEAGKDFVGGIGSWIKENKGPIEYDRKLLVPAGHAIIGGLNSSMIDQFKNVKTSVLGMGNTISTLFDKELSTDIGINSAYTGFESDMYRPQISGFDFKGNSNTQNYNNYEGFMKGAVFHIREEADIEKVANKVIQYNESTNYNREPGYLR